MKIEVICQECGKILCEIEKDEVTHEDLSMYSSSVICDVDTNAQVAAIKIAK